MTSEKACEICGVSFWGMHEQGCPNLRRDTTDPPPPDPGTPDLARLRALALAATPGNRVYIADGVWGGQVRTATDTNTIHLTDTPDLDDRPEDMEFIAACDPATVLALIDAAERTGAAERESAIAIKLLSLSKDALLLDGYFQPGEVGPDIAPRIIERLSAMRVERDRLAAEVARLRHNESVLRREEKETSDELIERDAEVARLAAEVAGLREQVTKAKAFAHDVSANYDHDGDAHRSATRLLTTGE